MNFKEFKQIAQAGKEKKMQAGSYMYRLHRKISAIISWLVIKIIPGILPNHITIANIAVLFMAVVLVFFENSQNQYWIIFIQLVLFNFTSILDKVDGEISRYKQYPTQAGVYYDLVFHFLFSPAFYFSLGYFFFSLTDNLTALFLAFIAGMIMSAEVSARKSRHHVKYKLELEGREKEIKDYVMADLAKQKMPSLPFKILNYSVFFVYDWVWTFYVALVFISIEWPILAFNFFVWHLVITITMVLYKLLVIYPRTSLYKAEDFNKSN